MTVLAYSLLYISNQDPIMPHRAWSHQKSNRRQRLPAYFWERLYLFVCVRVCFRFTRKPQLKCIPFSSFRPWPMTWLRSEIFHMPCDCSFFFFFFWLQTHTIYVYKLFQSFKLQQSHAHLFSFCKQFFCGHLFDRYAFFFHHSCMCVCLSCWAPLNQFQYYYYILSVLLY